MSNLPTLAQVIEEAKRQGWGHEYSDAQPCRYCSKMACYCPGTPCTVKIARAQQAAAAKALRWAYEITCDVDLKEAANAIEKELEK